MIQSKIKKQGLKIKKKNETRQQRRRKKSLLSVNYMPYVMEEDKR